MHLIADVKMNDAKIAVLTMGDANMAMQANWKCRLRSGYSYREITRIM